jgi:hypothetical protein
MSTSIRCLWSKFKLVFVSSPFFSTNPRYPYSSLGAVHDGSPPPSYLGGPGAGKCRWEDGFIMSDLRHTSKGFRWSTCTISQFKHFLKQVYFKNLAAPESGNKPIHNLRLYPGSPQS